MFLCLINVRKNDENVMASNQVFFIILRERKLNIKLLQSDNLELDVTIDAGLSQYCR